MPPKVIPLKRRNPNNPQIKSYIEAIKQGQKSIHIFYDGQSWKVKKIGDRNAEEIFHKKDEAFFHAREIAKKNKTEVIVHDRQGLILERFAY